MEEFAGNQELAIKEYIKKIGELAKVLEARDFFDGDKPAINDYTIASNIQNLKTIAPAAYKLAIENHPNPALLKWVNRVSELFDGYLKNRKTL
jgi:glutathione S-transferase